ncbi:MAG: class I SAM-dependent methyltransferase [Gemmatimonadota bacterium]
MTHSVSQHLALDVRDYDRSVRKFIPGYDSILDAVARWVKAVRPNTRAVFDLGGGTGALTARILTELPAAHVTLIDLDPAMLGVATDRLAEFGSRVTLKEGSFFDPLPPADAVVASLALHHVRELSRKSELYRAIHSALLPGGVFLTADVTISDEPLTNRTTYAFWAQHLEASGVENPYRHFAEWAGEDRYFSLEEEFEALRAGGFPRPECVWKYGPATVYGGVKAAG